MAISLKKSREGFEGTGASVESSTGEGLGDNLMVSFLSFADCGFDGLAEDDAFLESVPIFRTIEEVELA